MEVSGQFHVFAASPSGTDIPGPLEPQSRSGSCGEQKMLLLLLDFELDLSAVQPVARRCTDWAITALSIQWQNDINYELKRI
jgi:hypothetical protein